MEIRRKFYVTSISSTAVKLTRVPTVSPVPDSDPGMVIHLANLITGVATAANASTTFWQTGCHFYEMIIRRVD